MIHKLKQDFYDVQVSNYEPTKLENFFKNRTFYSVFKTMTNNTDKEVEERFIRFINRVLEQKKYFEQFMFDQSPDQQKLLTWLLEQDEEYRDILPTAIWNNIHTVSSALSTCSQEQFGEYIGVLFTLLNDESSAVGLKTLRTLTKLAKLSAEHEYKLLNNEYFILQLKQGLEGEDGTNVMRHIDLLVEISNLAEGIFELYKEKGLMEKILKAYKTDDILLKLVIVETIPKMGDTAWNAKYITNAMVSKIMVKECFDPETEFYVRKHLSVLIAKLIVRDLMPFDVKVKQNFTDMMKALLNSWSNEEAEGGIELIGIFLLRQYGLDLMFAHKELTLGLYQNAISTNESRKRKFLTALTNIFDQELEMKKPDLVRRCFVLAGDAQDLMQGKITLNELSNNFNKSFEFLFSLLFVPFVELELEALVLLKKMLLLEWFPNEFAKQSQAVKYFNENPAKSKEVFDLKKELRAVLIQRFDKSEDLHLINFKNKLVEGAKQQENGKPPKDMSYETDVL